MYKLFLALRYLRSRRVMFFPIAGVALGVMALVVVLSVMAGFDTELRKWVRGVNADLIVQGPGMFGIRNYPELVSRIEKVEHVEAAAPFVEAVALIKVGSNHTWCMVRGIDPEAESRVSDFGQYVPGDRGLDFTPPEGGPDLPGALVGSELMRDFFLARGDEIILVGLRARGTKPGYKKVVIASEFKLGMYEYDSTHVIIQLEEAISKDFLSTDGAVTGIHIRLDDYANAPVVKEKLNELFKENPILLRVMTWEEKRMGLLRAIALERRVMTVILSFVILVAGFATTAILTMVVADKIHDIGVIRAIGGTSKGVAAIFLAVGGVTTTIGAVLGTVAGVIFALNVNRVSHFIENRTGFSVFPSNLYYFDEIPTEIDPVRLAVIFVAAVAVGLLASLSPAFRAGRLDPLEAIRYE